MGCNGFLIRQFGDIAAERLRREDWQIRIEGVEIFPQYRNPTWDFAYDEVHMGDIREILPQLPKYDLILCTDVLEHFPLEEARALIRAMLEHAPTIIATTPNKYIRQGTWGGNIAETHHCVLTSRDFPGLVASEVTGITTCYISCSAPESRVVITNAALVCPRYACGRLSAIPKRAFNKLRRLISSPATRRSN